MKNASWQLVTVGDNLLVEWQKWDNQLKSPVHNKILKFLRVGEMADSVKCFLASMKTQVLIPGSQVKSGDMAHACRPDWGVKTPWARGPPVQTKSSRFSVRPCFKQGKRRRRTEEDNWFWPPASTPVHTHACYPPHEHAYIPIPHTQTRTHKHVSKRQPQ